MAKGIHPTWQHTALIAILLLGLALRLAPWGQNRLLEDEALYSYWGLQISTGTDPLLDGEPVDKPPLHPYTLALSYLLSAPSLVIGVGPGHETAARLPSLVASMAGIVLVYALGLALFGDQRIGLVAALLLTLSPFDILFASTAFTDPLMTAFVLGALLAAARDRPGAAGLLVGLAAATKQQGLFFLPLVVAINLLSPVRLDRRARAPKSKRTIPALAWLKRAWGNRWVRFALGFGFVAAGVLWWDSARLQHPGFFEQSFISYGGLGPAQAETLTERAVEWLQLVGAFWISPWFSGLVIVGLVAWSVGGLAGWCPGWTRIDLVLALFVVAFLLLHWLVGFQVWDRYLLGLVPLVALLAARAFVAQPGAIRARPWRRLYAVGLGVALAVTLIGPVLQAAQSELPVGGDHGAYDGIDHLATYMRTQAPTGSVLYHYWLGYHHRFYLYGVPLRLHWYPDLEDLAHDAYVYRREPRYIAFPSWQDASPVRAALSQAGISLEPVYETTRRDGSVSFRLYQLEGP
jgi:4-amino-4-deoxy-L-arabinose transferase-like glycosyltransferase